VYKEIIMLLPGIFVFRCVIADYKTAMNALILIVTAMLAASSAGRLRHAAKKL
jgi:hypothetical protein